jgi:hypothetical protein
MTKEKNKINYIKIFWIFVAVLATILIFFLIDYIVHSLSDEYAVPDYYFRNKIIFGTIWGLIIYFFIKKLSITKKSFVFSAFIAIVLQTRYYLEGYPIEFVIEFLFFHFLMLLAATLIIFNLMKNKLE